MGPNGESVSTDADWTDQTDQSGANTNHNKNIIKRLSCHKNVLLCNYLFEKIDGENDT